MDACSFLSDLCDLAVIACFAAVALGVVALRDRLRRGGTP